jgi:ABC-type antimicrobial peptide transport system permease subunit
MASLGLGIVGAYIGGPVGGFVGAAIGSYLDNAIILPALFPKDDPKSPRLGDIRFQSGAEGSPMALVLGPFNLLSGTVIWLGDRVEVMVDRKSAAAGDDWADVWDDSSGEAEVLD